MADKRNTPVTSTYLDYTSMTRDLQSTLRRIGQRQVDSREIEYYLTHIEAVKTVDDFVGDKRLMRFALRAHGLDSLSKATAFVRKLLEGGIDNTASLANKLADPRYAAFVGALNFARHGAVATIFDRARQGVVDKYLDQRLEEDAGTRNEGLRLALYFRRKAPQLRDHYAILADKALAQVARTALGLSGLTAQADIDTQKQQLANRIDLADFKDAEMLDRFIVRFCALWDGANAAASQPANAILAATTTDPLAAVSNDVLAALQTLKR